MTVRALTLIAAVGILSPAPGATIAPDVRTMLASTLKFTAGDFADIEKGRIVKHGIDAPLSGEVAVVGGERVNAPVASFIERVRNIETFKRGPDVIQIGRFSIPPEMRDLDALTVGREDADMRRCRIGSCDIRLPAAAIARFQREIDWTAPDADRRAGDLFKTILFEHVRAYTLGDRGRITEYNDEKRAVRPGDDFDALLKNAPYVGRLVPGFPAHLRDMRGQAVPGAEDFLYWSKEKFGLTPFITVTHMVIAPASTGTYVVASRDVYSTRYFDASLSYTVATAAVGTPDVFYLVYANRSRAAALKGAFAGLRRSIVERRVKNALEETLKSIRLRLERHGR